MVFTEVKIGKILIKKLCKSLFSYLIVVLLLVPSVVYPLNVDDFLTQYKWPGKYCINATTNSSYVCEYTYDRLNTLGLTVPIGTSFRENLIWDTSKYSCTTFNFTNPTEDDITFTAAPSGHKLTLDIDTDHGPPVFAKNFFELAYGNESYKILRKENDTDLVEDTITEEFTYWQKWNPNGKKVLAGQTIERLLCVEKNDMSQSPKYNLTYENGTFNKFVIDPYFNGTGGVNNIIQLVEGTIVSARPLQIKASDTARGSFTETFEEYQDNMMFLDMMDSRGVRWQAIHGHYTGNGSTKSSGTCGDGHACFIEGTGSLNLTYDDTRKTSLENLSQYTWNRESKFNISSLTGIIKGIPTNGYLTFWMFIENLTAAQSGTLGDHPATPAKNITGKIVTVQIEQGDGTRNVVYDITNLSGAVTSQKTGALANVTRINFTNGWNYIKVPLWNISVQDNTNAHNLGWDNISTFIITTYNPGPDILSDRRNYTVLIDDLRIVPSGTLGQPSETLKNWTFNADTFVPGLNHPEMRIHQHFELQNTTDEYGNPTFALKGLGVPNSSGTWDTYTRLYRNNTEGIENFTAIGKFKSPQATGTGFGFMFRINETSNEGYMVDIPSTVIRLSHISNGTEMNGTSLPFTVVKNQWTWLKVIANGTWIEVYNSTNGRDFGTATFKGDYLNQTSKNEPGSFAINLGGMLNYTSGFVDDIQVIAHNINSTNATNSFGTNYPKISDTSNISMSYLFTDPEGDMEQFTNATFHRNGVQNFSIEYGGLINTSDTLFLCHFQGNPTCISKAGVGNPINNSEITFGRTFFGGQNALGLKTNGNTTSPGNITYNHSVNFDETNGTILIWFKGATSLADAQGTFFQTGSGNYQNLFRIQYHNLTAFDVLASNTSVQSQYCNWNDPGVLAENASSGGIVPGSRNFIAVTWNSTVVSGMKKSTISLYTNGAAGGKGTCSDWGMNISTINEDQFSIGSALGNTGGVPIFSNWLGNTTAIEDFAIVNKSLTSASIKDLWERGVEKPFTIESNRTTAGENWSVSLISYDTRYTSGTLASNNITIFTSNQTNATVNINSNITMPYPVPWVSTFRAVINTSVSHQELAKISQVLLNLTAPNGSLVVTNNALIQNSTHLDNWYLNNKVLNDRVGKWQWKAEIRSNQSATASVQWNFTGTGQLQLDFVKTQQTDFGFLNVITTNITRSTPLFYVNYTITHPNGSVIVNGTGQINVNASNYETWNSTSFYLDQAGNYTVNMTAENADQNISNKIKFEVFDRWVYSPQEFVFALPAQSYNISMNISFKPRTSVNLTYNFTFGPLTTTNFTSKVEFDHRNVSNASMHLNLLNLTSAASVTNGTYNFNYTIWRIPNNLCPSCKWKNVTIPFIINVSPPAGIITLKNLSHDICSITKGNCDYSKSVLQGKPGVSTTWIMQNTGTYNLSRCNVALDGELAAITTYDTLPTNFTVIAGANQTLTLTTNPFDPPGVSVGQLNVTCATSNPSGARTQAINDQRPFITLTSLSSLPGGAAGAPATPAGGAASPIKVEKPVEKEVEIISGPVCGNNRCDKGEDRIACPSDCGEINLDSLFCIGDAPCLWRQNWFIRVILFGLLLGLFWVIVGQEEEKNKKKRELSKKKSRTPILLTLTRRFKRKKGFT